MLSLAARECTRGTEREAHDHRRPGNGPGLRLPAVSELPGFESPGQCFSWYVGECSRTDRPLIGDHTRPPAVGPAGGRFFRHPDPARRATAPGTAPDRPAGILADGPARHEECLNRKRAARGGLTTRAQ